MDETGIGNMALGAIGTRSTIPSLTEPSTEAENVLLYYAPTRDELLRQFNWDWATFQLPLALWKSRGGTPENPNGVGVNPASPWLYAYTWPADCIRALSIEPQLVPQAVIGLPLTTGPTNGGPLGRRRQPVDFKVAGDRDAVGNPVKIILTNQSQAVLNYTGRVTDPNVWDSLFVVALVGRLAGKLVIPLSGDKALAQIAIKAGMAAETQAEAANGNEGIFSTDHTPEWIADRQGYDDGEGDY